MADIWTVEATLDNFTRTGPIPSADHPNEFITLGITADDFSQVNISIALGWMLEAHSFGGGPTYEYRTVATIESGNNNSPILRAVPPALVHATLTEADGQNGAAFFGGGKLKLIKDENTNTLTAETPLGNMTVSFAALGMGTGTFKPETIFHEWRRPTNVIGLPVNPDASNRIDWSGFWGELNGNRWSGASLGTNQPGEWDSVGGPDDPWLVTGNIVRNNGETENRLQSGFSYTHATDAPRNLSTYEFRAWDNNGSIGEIPVVIDLERNKSMGQVLYARVLKQTPERVTIGYTEDSGSTWTEVEVDEGIGAFCSPPSLGVNPAGQYTLVFHNGTDAVIYLSDTGGKTWDPAGAFVPFLSWSSLRYPVHHQHNSGILIVTYNTGGDLLASAFSVATGVLAPLATNVLVSGLGASVLPSITTIASGVIYLVVDNGTNKIQFFSDDYGVSWTTHFNMGSVERATRLLYHDPLGLTAHLYTTAGATGDLTAYLSDTLGLTDLLTGPVIVEAGIAEQVADIEALPNGFLLVAYQEHNMLTDRWEVVCERSADLGVSWALA